MDSWFFQNDEKNDSSSKNKDEELYSDPNLLFRYSDYNRDTSFLVSDDEGDNSPFCQEFKFNNDDNILENLKKNKDSIFCYNYKNNGNNNNENIGNSVTNCVSNKNSGKKNGSEKFEKIKDSEKNVNSSNNVNQKNDIVKNKKKIFTIAKKKKIAFKVIKTRKKRKEKNGIAPNKLRLYNIELKFKGIVIDSIINYINKKFHRFKFKVLKYEIKKKHYEKLKKLKLKNIMLFVSRKYINDSNNNKSMIKKIEEEKEYSQLREILELTVFDVFYHILIEETNILTGLRQEYRTIYANEILNKKTQDYIQGFGKVLIKYENYVNNRNIYFN